MTIITIPRSREDMVSRLTGIQRLLTATQWEKAAILAAFVQVDNKPGPRSRKSTRSLTPVEFRELGVAGLRSDKTITKYVRRWIATTRPIPKPGDEVDLDGLPEWDTETVDAPASPSTPKVTPAPAPPAKERAPRPRKWDDLTPEEQDADNAIAEEGGKELVRITKERMAVEDTAKRGQVAGDRMALEVMYLITEMIKYRHFEAVERILMKARGLLDLEQAEDLTPEMFHD